MSSMIWAMSINCFLIKVIDCNKQPLHCFSIKHFLFRLADLKNNHEQTYKWTSHYHLFWNVTFFHAQLGLDICHKLKPLHIYPWTVPIQAAKRSSFLSSFTHSFQVFLPLLTLLPLGSHFHISTEFSYVGFITSILPNIPCLPNNHPCPTIIRDIPDIRYPARNQVSGWILYPVSCIRYKTYIRY